MNWEQKLAEYLEAFEAAAVDMGPKTLELALQITRVEAIGSLVLGLFLAGVVALMAFVIVRGVGLMRTRDFHDEGIGSSMIAGGGIVGFTTLLFAAELLLDIWNWVGAFAPQIKLAKDILDKVVGS